MIAQYEPVMQRALTDSILAAWLAGGARVAKRAPEEETAVALPPELPPIFAGRVAAPEDEPIIHYPIIEEAARALADKRVMVRADFDALEQDAKREAFTVARVGTIDALQRIQAALVEDVAEGGTLRLFEERIADALDASALSPSQVESTYRTHVAQAYSDGFWKAMAHPLVASEFPYVEYSAVHDSRTRPTHRAMETLGIQGTAIYRADDPVVRRFRTPWDHQCRCNWIPLTLEQAAARGILEAIEWLRTGVPPAHPAWVASPPFDPPADFGGAMRLSLGTVRLGWVDHGRSAGGQQRWKETDSGEIRYQDSKPGDGEKGQGDEETVSVPATSHDSPAAKALAAPIAGRKRIGNGGINWTEIVRMENGAKGVWKPGPGEYNGARASITGEQWRREVASSELAEALGFGDLVPTTIARTVPAKEGSIGAGEPEIGSIQAFVPHARSAIKEKRKGGNMFDGAEDLARAAVLDFITLNTDRHANNWMLRGSKLVLIDNGLTFPNTHDKPDAGTSQLLNEAVRRNLPLPDVAAWKDKGPAIEAMLKKNGVGDKETALAMERFAHVLKAAEAGHSIGEMWHGAGIKTLQKMDRGRDPYPVKTAPPLPADLPRAEQLGWTDYGKSRKGEQRWKETSSGEIRYQETMPEEGGKTDNKGGSTGGKTDAEDPAANRPSKPNERHKGAKPKALPWSAPPPKVPRSEEFKRPTGDESQTKVGDLVEALAKQLGFRSILPEGQRSHRPGEVAEKGSTIDVEFDHSGRAYEIKACNTTSTEYRLKAKASEKEAKLKYATMNKLEPYTMVAVRNAETREVHFYAAKEPGLIGAEVSDKAYDFVGTVKY